MTSFGTVISFPIPPYQNLPIEAQFYEPSRFVISNITLGITTLVTTSLDHNYVIGQEIRLLIPSNFGCFQLNNRKGYVLSIPSSTQVQVSIDSSQNVNNFIFATNNINMPQIIAIGDINSGVVNSNGRVLNSTFISGSFINISPN